MYEYQRQKKEFAEAIWYLSSKPDIPFENAVVIIDYYFKDNRRRDADNYSGKIILDGLVKCGIIKDDSYKNIVSMPFFYCDKINPHTTITVIKKCEIGAIRDKIRGILYEV